jgi:putative nucleotidyltransferase with HDIG domain
LYWTALLHDIGKAQTFSRDANGNVHYFDHERVGSQMIDSIAKKWKMSTALKDGIIWIIKSHLLPQKLTEMKKIKVYRLMLHPHFPLLLQLTMAD